MDIAVAAVAAVAALIGVFLGDRLRHDAWRRDRRLEAAVNVLTAVDEFLFTLPTADRPRQEQAAEKLWRAHVILALVGQTAIAKASGRCVVETRRLLFDSPSPAQAIAIADQLQISRNELIDKAGAALGFRERIRPRKPGTRRALRQGT